MTHRILLCIGLILVVSGCHAAGAKSPPLRIAVFELDATPSLGAVLGDGACPPVAKIDDRLSCKGVVLLADDGPVVLCVVDWIGIGNGGHDAWRAALAQAAGTTPDRVAVHASHAHDTPGCDFDAEALLAQHGLSGAEFDPDFARKTITSAAEAVKAAMKNPRTVSHIGFGKAKVERVASSRRALGPDGKVKWVRWSATADPVAREQPEGVIDPFVRIVSFWDGDKPVTAMSYYACHPQSHYRKGAVSCDVPGLARNVLQESLGFPCIHFNGAGGDVTHGKYNDGNPANRAALTSRLAEGMKGAWEATEKFPVSTADVSWCVEPVALPLAQNLDEQKQRATLANAKQPVVARVNAARELAWINRCKSGHRVELSCFSVGPVRILHMPGELFVEYQLAAQAMRPDLRVALAAYGDYGMGYIGTKIAYTQGGYEVEPGVSLVSDGAEAVLMAGMKKLLEK